MRSLVRIQLPRPQKPADSCGGVSQLDHAGPDPCSKASCDYDRAFIGGNLDVAVDMPVRVTIETCKDGVCAEPVELEPGVGWAPAVFGDDGELVGSYAITIADADSRVVLEDHSFVPTYETVGVRDCEAVEGAGAITCTHFVASWR